MLATIAQQYSYWTGSIPISLNQLIGKNGIGVARVVKQQSPEFNVKNITQITNGSIMAFGKYDNFSVAELQHIYGSLLCGQRVLFSTSPIIGPMLQECGESLNEAILKLEALEAESGSN
jgi:hypothetical protein